MRFTKIYQVNRVPDPVASLGKVITQTLTVADMAADPILYILLPGCLLDVRFEVLCFDAVFVRKNTNKASFEKVSDNHFTNACFDMIMKLSPGDQIIFDNIKVSGPSSVIRTLQGFTITIR
jgi:hypothetical protein